MNDAVGFRLKISFRGTVSKFTQKTENCLRNYSPWSRLEEVTSL